MSQKLSPENSRQALDGEKTNQTAGNSEYHQLNTQHNVTQQFRSSASEPQHNQYNSDSQRKILTNFQQSFNEQRETYTEQAFNSHEQQPNDLNTAPPHYDYEKSFGITLDDNTIKEVQRYLDKDFEQYAERITGYRRPKPSHESPDTVKLGSEVTLNADQIKAIVEETDKIEEKAFGRDLNFDRDFEQYVERIAGSPKSKEEKETYKRISHDKSSRLINEDGDNRLHEDDVKKRLYDKHNITDENEEKTREYADKDEDTLKHPLKRNDPRERKKLSDHGNTEKTEIVTVEKVKFERIKGEKELRAVQKSVNKKYNKQVGEHDRKELKNRIKGRLIFSHAKSLFDDENIQKDDEADVFRKLKKGGRATAFILRQNQRDLRNMYSRYGRLKFIIKRDQYHISKHERLDNKAEHRKERRYVKEASSKEERKRRKKEMQKARVEREGNIFRRTQNQFKMTKRKADYKMHKTKRTLKTVAAVGSIVGISMLSGVIVLLVILCVAQGTVEYYAEGVVQADYGTMTDATEYYKNLETDLEEYLSDKATLEFDLKSEHGNDIYEFHYNICNFGFSANTILAYVAAKYNEFALDEIVKNDLKEVFQQMYTLNVYTRMETRKINDVDEEKKICYVTLSRTELEEVVESRLTDDQLELYASYKLTTGGQQIYGPVMRENWTNLISSNYGDRIHPITKVRTTHKGVDIAVPTGTKLYSAVKGIVTVAHYSETAGNMVTVKNSTGWTVTFMHMDSIAVSVNQSVERGDFVGYSGNTGNSTGPHLHLQVNDASGNTVNPIFIIPQTCAVVNDE